MEIGSGKASGGADRNVGGWMGCAMSVCRYELFGVLDWRLGRIRRRLNRSRNLGLQPFCDAVKRVESKGLANPLA